MSSNTNYKNNTTERVQDRIFRVSICYSPYYINVDGGFEPAIGRFIGCKIPYWHIVMCIHEQPLEVDHVLTYNRRWQLDSTSMSIEMHGCPSLASQHLSLASQIEPTRITGYFLGDPVAAHVYLGKLLNALTAFAQAWSIPTEIKRHYFSAPVEGRYASTNRAIRFFNREYDLLQEQAAAESL